MGVRFLSVAAAAVFALASAGSAFAARPIARWDVVPGQRVSDLFNVGVVAFHEKGAKVEFTVDGKAAATVAEPAKNPRTGIVEHFFAFDPKGRADGPAKIGATVTAEGAEPLALPEIVLYADCGKTQGSHKTVWVDSAKGNDFADGSEARPFKTIKMAVKRVGDGGTVFLKPGNYTSKLVGGGRARSFWTLVTAAPGVARQDVRVQGGKTGTERLHFKDVEIFCDVTFGHGFVLIGEDGETSVWVDGCRMYSKSGREVGPVVPFVKYRAYVTGGSTEDMTSGPHAEIVRGHAVRRISGTAFSGGGMLVAGCEVDDVAPSPGASDPDLYRACPPRGESAEDVVLYGVRATGLVGRTLYIARLRNAAVVDVGCEATTKSLVHTQFFDKSENMLFARVETPSDMWQFINIERGRDNFAPTDVRMFGVKPQSFKGLAATDGSAGMLVSDEVPACFPKGDK